ncbi:MAG: phosphoribosyltransferase [Candidatus Roizmanbacteria bacterium]|nr:MAG: phosphoribosyltransferase [Candidatus Roizmanbacteria bacterium]
MQVFQSFHYPQTFFKDRKDAGRKLAEKLITYCRDRTLLCPYSIVLALPRGGVIVGYEIAQKLNVPLDVIIVRKIGAPEQPELGVGAISENNTLVLNENKISTLGYSKNQIDEVIEKEKKEMKRRIELYRSNRPLPDLKDKTVILVDDGLATGVTALAAITALSKLKPKQLIIALPVCSNTASRSFNLKVDDFICLHSLFDFQAIGLYYENFEQTTDEEVINLLKKSRDRSRPVPTKNH